MIFLVLPLTIIAAFSIGLAAIAPDAGILTHT